jgi:uncharacterized membrane protein
MNQFTASLWGDEAFAAVLAQKPYWQIILSVARDTSPPLFYLSLHTWMKIFGTNEVAIRAHSFLYFLLLVYVVYLIGQALFDKRTGIIAAALTFFNPFLFQYGFEGRMYSILAFFSTLSMYFFLTKKRVPHILATTAALYSHHFSIFIIFVQLFLSWSELRKNFGKTIQPFLIIGFLYLPWWYPLYYQTSLVESGFWLAKPGLEELYHLLRNYLVGIYTHPWQSLVFVFSLLTFGLRRWSKKDLPLLTWFLLSVLLTFIVSHVKESIFFDRYLLFVVPALTLLMASRGRYITYPLLALLIFGLVFMNLYYFTHPTKRPFRQLANFIRIVKNSDDFLINWSGKAHHLFESKYYQLKAPLYYPSGELPFYIGTALMEKQDVIRTLPQKERIGVITSNQPATLYLPYYQAERTYYFNELKFIWFSKKL